MADTLSCTEQIAKSKKTERRPLNSPLIIVEMQKQGTQSKIRKNVPYNRIELDLSFIITKQAKRDDNNMSL